MSFPGGIQFTNAGLLLSSKTLLGKQVTFTRLAVGDGELGGQSPVERTSLVHEVESVEINKLVPLSDTEVTVGGPFTNQGLATGFWWREFGVFAQDPDTLQEKLYAYGNAGVLADYIPAGGGAEILEKQLDATILVSASASISAVINSSLVYASAQDLLDHRNDGAAHGATAAATAGKIMLRDANGRAQVSDPAAALDIVNKQTLETAMALAVPKATNTAGTDAYTITLSGVTAYTDGLLVLMRTAVANTGAASLNINGLGAKPIRTFKAGVDADISTGEIPANSQVLLCYSSTAVAGAGGFVSLNIRDADLLDGQHGSYYLPASSYTAADVLAKVKTVDGTGSALDSDTVDGNHFRTTNGYLEYSTDGVVWNPVGIKLVKASDTVQHSWPTERTATAGQYAILAGRIIPNFKGTIRIKGEIKSSNTTQVQAILAAPKGTPVSGVNQPNGSGVLAGNVATLPLGTQGSTLPYSLSDGTALQLAGNSTTSYVAFSADVSVEEGIPVAVLAATQSGSCSPSIRNLTYSYTEISATEVG